MPSCGCSEASVLRKPEHPGWLVVPSPNFHPGRKPGVPVTGIVLHFTAAGSGRRTAEYFAKREVSWREGEVTKTAKVSASAHVVIDRDGTVYQCVSLGSRAWHAGPSTHWQGQPLNKGQNVNDWTVGIEIANWGQVTRTPGVYAGYLNYLKRPYQGPAPFVAADGTYWEPYPEAQLAAVERVCKVLLHMFPAITRENVLGHSDVDPKRKVDPGPAWPSTVFLDELFGSAAEQADELNALEDDDRAGYYDEAEEMCLVQKMT